MVYLVLVVIFAALSSHVVRRLYSAHSRDIKHLLNLLCYGFLLLIMGLYTMERSFGIELAQQLTLEALPDLCMFGMWCVALTAASAAIILVEVIWLGVQKRESAVRFSKGQERCALACLTVLLGCGGIWFSVEYTASQGLYITEICTDEVSLQPSGLQGEYVEIYNPSPIPVQLKYYSLTDDPENLEHYYRLPDMEIPAQGFAVVHLEDIDRFSIRNAGESIYLLHGMGNTIVDSVLAQMLPDPVNRYNWVFAKNPDTQLWEIQNPSPMERNAPEYGINDVLPEFSVDSGFYEEAFFLTLSAPEGYRIYYTLDSSTPSENALIYTEPIRVVNRSDQPNVYLATQNIVGSWQDSDHNTENMDKAFVVRAMTVDSQGRKSRTVSKTYFVDLEKYSGGYVLSVVTDFENLIGEDGICVTGRAYDEWYLSGKKGEMPSINYLLTGKEAEIPANIELLRNNEVLLNCGSGLRLQGASNRSNPIKRLRLVAREAYSGSRFFQYPLFASPTHSFYTRDGFGDVLSQLLLMDTDIAGGGAKRAAVFVNGEYWCKWYLRERFDEDWIASKFQVNADDVRMYDTMPEEITAYVHSHDMQSETAYAGFQELVDVQNLMRFYAANLYYNNTDLAEWKNMRLWRTEFDTGTEFGDGRYRFLVYDLDCLEFHHDGYFTEPNYALNTFVIPFMWADNPYVEGTVFWELKKNEAFCRDFVLTFMDMANTCFEKERVAQVLESRGYDRSWNECFFDRRAEYILPYLAEALDLSGTLETLTLVESHTDAGTIRINSVELQMKDGKWTGQYYTDFPVTVTAEPKDGWEFAGWYHEGTTCLEETLEISLEDGENLWEARYRRIGE